jgi:ADP-dependent NAD(P)H-hydrate dehydratase / NAD(P)H-hydrate epimerase
MTKEKGLSVKELRALEETARKIGLNERVLIENASSNLFHRITRLDIGNKALVIAGRGNNGADVLSCARKLFSHGYQVDVVVLEEKPLNEEAAWQKMILKALGVNIHSIKSSCINELAALFAGANFILEGIFGIGIVGEVDSFNKQIISLINKSGKKIISCDIPSGLSPDEGIILGAAIKARYTVSFIDKKKGFFINEGPKLCGKVFVVDIGISKETLEKVK